MSSVEFETHEISVGSWLKLGDRIIAVQLIDLSPYTIIKPGERGTVTSVEAGTLYTEIVLDHIHKGLAEWDNHLWLMPEGTPEILTALRRKEKKGGIWAPTQHYLLSSQLLEA